VYQRIRLFVCANSVKTADSDTYQEIPDTRFKHFYSVEPLRPTESPRQCETQHVGRLVFLASKKAFGEEKGV